MMTKNLDKIIVKRNSKKTEDNQDEFTSQHDSTKASTEIVPRYPSKVQWAPTYFTINAIIRAGDDDEDTTISAMNKSSSQKCREAMTNKTRELKADKLLDNGKEEENLKVLHSKFGLRR